MIIDAHVLSIDSNSESLIVAVQGRKRGATDQTPWLRFTIQVPENEQTRPAYFIGRKLKITVEPK